jgi:hypothetical protein
MELVAGATAMVKSGAVTFSVTFALCANSSVPVPVMARMELPPGVLADVVTVMVELPDPGIAAGENEAEAPEGRPAAESVTGSVKPYSGETLTV